MERSSNKAESAGAARSKGILEFLSKRRGLSFFEGEPSMTEYLQNLINV